MQANRLSEMAARLTFALYGIKRVLRAFGVIRNSIREVTIIILNSE